jgi:hypothetical protein
MTSNANLAAQKAEVSPNEGPETLPDIPLLDLSGAAVMKLISTAKERG